LTTVTPENAKKRILMICPFARPNEGGVESHLDKLIDYLAGHKVFVYLISYQPLTTSTKGKPVEKGQNFVIYRINWFGQGWFNRIEKYFPLTFLYLVPGLLYRNIIFYLKNHQKIDTIHAHGFAAAFVAKVLKRIHKKRTVVSTHAVYNLEKRKVLASLVRWLLSSFDFILAVGEASKEELIRIGIDSGKVRVHPNWVDTDTFKPHGKKESRRLSNLPQDKFIILFVGRLIAKKGILLLIEIAKQVSGEMVFVIVGAEGPESSQVDKAAETLGSFINVKGLPAAGKPKQEAISRYYNSADMFVLPSQYPEGFASVILEGIACGTPIISTNTGCVPQIIDESVGVLLNPTKDNLKEIFEYFYRHRDKLKEKARNCRPYALEHFSEKNAEIILNSYQDD